MTYRENRELLGMPNIVLDRILKHSDFKSIFTLRGVCKSLRDLIDDSKPDLKLDSPKILTTLDGFTLEIESKSFNEPKMIKYRNVNRVYLRDPARPYTAKTILLQNPISKFQEDVGRVLDHQKSTLDTFDIAVKYMRHTPEHAEVLNFIQQKLESRPTPLKTLSFRMSAMNQNQALQIFKNLDSRKIQNLSIQYTLVNAFGRANTHLQIDEIMELDQFKSAKKLDLIRFTVDSKIENFLHFEEVNVHLESISREEAVALRKKFLSANSTMKRCEIIYNNFLGIQEFGDSMGVPYRVDFGYNWYIRMPNHPAFALSIFLGDVFMRQLIFSKVQLSSVPEPVVLLDL